MCLFGHKIPQWLCGIALDYGKGQCGSKTQRSLPKLELAAADLAVKMSELLYATTKIPSKKYHYWSDSYNVLYWILKNSRELPVFEANRVAAIQISSDIRKWKHVPGEINPADIITRPRTPAALSENKFGYKD